MANYNCTDNYVMNKTEENIETMQDKIEDIIYEYLGNYNVLDLNDIIVNMVKAFPFSSRTSIDYLIEDLENLKNYV